MILNERNVTTFYDFLLLLLMCNNVKLKKSNIYMNITDN